MFFNKRFVIEFEPFINDNESGVKFPSVFEVKFE